MEGLLDMTERLSAALERLLQKVDIVVSENKLLKERSLELEEELKDTREELLAIEQKTDREMLQSRDALRQLREAMLQLMETTRAKLGE